MRSDWVHDRYEDDRYDRNRRRPTPDHDLPDRPRRFEEYVLIILNVHEVTSADCRTIRNGTKLKVDNIHYELTESDLRVRAQFR